MAVRVGSLNFSKGEISEELVARVDVPSYQSAVKTARNVVVLKYGGLAKRPGTHLVSEVHWAGAPVRLLPFQYSIQQAFVLEMGDFYMRPMALGGMVIENEKDVTGITQEAQAVVTVAGHGYGILDTVYFSGIQGMTEINGRFGRVVAVISSSQFRVDIDTTNFTAFVGEDTPDPPPPPSRIPRTRGGGKFRHGTWGGG
jgi:hypothetical protein